MNIPKKDLLSAIETAAVALPRKASLPVYYNIRIESANGGLTVTATDDDQYALGSVECNSPMEPFCVNYKSLANLLPLMAENVWMEIKDKRLHISSGGAFNLAISDAAEFPAWDAKGSKAIGVNCADLAAAIKTVSFACSTDYALRAIQCNVHVECKDKAIVTTASNGKELARVALPAIAAKCEFLLPVAMVKNFCEAMNQEGAVFWLSENKATVKHTTGEYSTKLWEGKYMNYEEVFSYKRTALGEINPALWLPIFKSCVADEENGKLTSRVIIDDKHVYHTGLASQIEVPIPDKLEICKLKVNATALIPCFEHLGEKTKLSVISNDGGELAVLFEHGNLLVISAMLVG